MDIENLQLSYDISNGTNNPGNVKMVAADLTTAGACSPVAVRADSDPQGEHRAVRAATATLGNNPTAPGASQHAPIAGGLRGMAFVDRYRPAKDGK